MASTSALPSSSNPDAAEPAFRGFVETTLDALLVFEGCKRNLLPKISRRLQEFEKRALVLSGAVFVFDEDETGIKRWTDGLSWSPSRTLGNFLVYRELDKKASRKQGSGGGEEGAEGDEDGGEGLSRGGGRPSARLMGGLTSKADPPEGEEESRPGSSSERPRTLSEAAASLQLDRARERALVGSLTSSYRFRADGLVKKTISLNGLHLIGYYRIADVTSGRLRTPSSHPELAALRVSPNFLAPSLFRVPPIVEIGPDGQLTYKGESDTPLSPVTASGSSAGFPTPGLNQSRPTSSSDAVSHFSSLLPSNPSNAWERNRFDPYSSTSRFSPGNTSFPSNASYPFPLIPNGQLPHSRSPFPTPNGEADAGDGAFQARTPPVDQLSTSAPLTEGWGGPQAGPSSGAAGLYSSLPPSGRATYLPQQQQHEQVPNSPSFYQPRQAMPYAPTSDATTSNAIFAYNPPPPSTSTLPQSRYQLPGGSPQQGYQPYPLPLQYSQQGRPGSSSLGLPPYSSTSSYTPNLPTSIESSHSPFATPLSTAAPSLRSSYPIAPHSYLPPNSSHSQAPPAHGSPALQAPGSSAGWNTQLPSALSRSPYDPSAGTTTSLAQQAASLMADLGPHSPADPRAGFAQPQQSQGEGGYSYLPQQQSQQQYSHPTSSSSYAASYPSHSLPNQSGYAPYQPTTASGLVGALPNSSGGIEGSSSLGGGGRGAGLNEDVVPASGHGLGVSAFGEIVPASSFGGLTSPTLPSRSQPPSHPSASSSYGVHLVQSSSGLRQPPPPLPNVGLSPHQAYQLPPHQQQQQQYLPPHQHQHPQQHQQQGFGRYGSPVDSNLAGLLERHNERQQQQQQQQQRGLKREAPEDGHQHPLSPPMGPPRGGGGGWWDGGGGGGDGKGFPQG